MSSPSIPVPHSESAGLPPERVSQRRQSNVMLSRVAAGLYWMSRYLERAENTSRLLDVNLQLQLDFIKIDDETLKEHWLPILRSTGDEELFFSLYDSATSESVTEFMTFRADNPNSVLSCLTAARENARQIRDQISIEMWEVLNDAFLFLQSSNARSMWAGGASQFYEKVKNYSHLFQGLTDSTFARNEGYEFIQFGKFVERADKTSRILDLKYHILLPTAADVGGAVDTAQWQAVLRSASGLEAYRRFYVAEILPWKVAEFLIFSEAFPRSLRYCLERIDHFLHRIAGTPQGQYRSEGERVFGKLLSDLNFNTIEDILKAGLHQYLKHVQEVLDRVAAFVNESFMTHPPVDLAAEVRIHQQEQQQQQRK